MDLKLERDRAEILGHDLFKVANRLFTTLDGNPFIAKQLTAMDRSRIEALRAVMNEINPNWFKDRYRGD